MRFGQMSSALALLIFVCSCSGGSDRDPTDGGGDGGDARDGADARDAARDSDEPDGTPSCALPLARLPAGVAARCEKKTQTCVANCSDAADVSACITECTEADQMPALSGALDCYRCLAYYQIRCWSMNECETQWGDFRCCADEAGCQDDTCAAENCPAEADRLNACGRESADTCPPLWAEGDFADCYADFNVGDDAGTDGGMDAGDDAGAGDAGDAGAEDAGDASAADAGDAGAEDAGDAGGGDAGDADAGA
jgi:hypothetical protein